MGPHEALLRGELVEGSLQGPFLLLPRGYPGSAEIRAGWYSLGCHLPVLEPVLCVLEPGLQVPDANFLLLQWSQVLLWGGGFDAMVVTAECILHGAPARVCPSEVGDEEGRASTQLGQGAPNYLQAQPVPSALLGAGDMAQTQPAFCEVSFNEALLREELVRGLETPLLREEGISHEACVCSAPCDTLCGSSQQQWVKGHLCPTNTHTHTSERVAQPASMRSVCFLSPGCLSSTENVRVGSKGLEDKDSPAEKVASSWEGDTLLPAAESLSSPGIGMGSTDTGVRSWLSLQQVP